MTCKIMTTGQKYAKLLIWSRKIKLIKFKFENVTNVLY